TGLLLVLLRATRLSHPAVVLAAAGDRPASALGLLPVLRAADPLGAVGLSRPRANIRHMVTRHRGTVLSDPARTDLLVAAAVADQNPMGGVLLAPVWRWLFHGYLPDPSWQWLLPGRLDALFGGVLLACYMRGYCRSATAWGVLACVPPLC